MPIVNPIGYREIIKSVNLDQMRNKSVFITGGTGFFGFWLLNLLTILNADGFGITATLLSRNPEQFLADNPQYKDVNWLHWVTGDVESYEFPDRKFEMFIHGAANTKPESLNKQVPVFDSIVFGTKHLLEHACISGARRFLLISSGAVYGEVPEGLEAISEDVVTSPHTNKPENAYGDAKRAAEMLGCCYAFEKGIEVVTARCFAFTGYGIGGHLVLGLLIKQALNNDHIIINGSGLARRSFLHGRDLSIWLLKLLADGINAEIYNVGSDEAYSILGLAELVRDELAPGKKITVLGAQKKEQRLNYIPSIEKARSLGLGVWTTLRDAIKET